MHSLIFHKHSIIRKVYPSSVWVILEKNEELFVEVIVNVLSRKSMHDDLRTQFKVPAKGHQMWIAHLFRELNYFTENGDKWSVKLKQKLKASLALLDKIKNYPLKNYRRSINKINQILGSKEKGEESELLLEIE